MMFISKVHCAAILLCLFVLGCKTVNTVSPKEPLARKQIIADTRVITDPILGNRAEVIALSEAITPGGFAKVQVELRNNSSRTRHIEYLFEWFDANGMILPSSSRVYQTRELIGGETISLTSIAPTTSARDFRLKLTRANR